MKNLEIFIIFLCDMVEEKFCEFLIIFIKNILKNILVI